MEEWKDIKGYEGLYQVSDTGRVRSYYSGTWKIMKQSTRVDAEKETGTPHSNIIACCKGRLKTANGYVWKYST